MDKNTIIGFVLIGAILFTFSWLNRPTEESISEARKLQQQQEQAAIQQQKADSIAQLNAQQTTQLIDSLSTIDNDSLELINRKNTFGAFFAVAQGTEDYVELSNDLIKLKISTKGGRICETILRKYQTYDSLPLALFDEKENQYGFIFNTGSRFINTQDLYFTPIIGTQSNSVTMRLDLGNGSNFDLVYTLDPESYRVKMDIHQSAMARILPQNTTELNFYWKQHMRRQEKGRMFEERNSGIFYKFYGSDVENLSETSDDNKSINTGIKWVGFKNQFFSNALIADNKFNGVTLKSTIDNSGRYLKRLSMEGTFDYTPAMSNVEGFTFFLGPNSYPLLSSYDNDVPAQEQLELDKLVPLGFSFFRWINTWIIIPMFTFFGKFLTNYGIIILLMTIVIKIFLMPLTFKSYMSSARMRVLKPQVDEINAKYPGNDKAMDRQRATMDLYSKAGVNPMSGCLPMLLQMPILLAMFAFFPSSIELRQQPFLWADDLSTYDAIISWNAQIPLISEYFGNHISLFCLLMTITNIIYTKINMDSTGGQQQMPGMKIMMYTMPLMFLFIFNNYASGLSYYYFVSTLITIIQTYIFRKSINEEKVLAQLKANQKKPKKKSGFMARLAEAQRKQEAAVREQRKKGNR